MNFFKPIPSSSLQTMGCTHWSCHSSDHQLDYLGPNDELIDHAVDSSRKTVEESPEIDFSLPSRFESTRNADKAEILDLLHSINTSMINIQKNIGMEINSLRGEMKGEFNSLSGEIDGLRGELASFKSSINERILREEMIKLYGEHSFRSRTEFQPTQREFGVPSVIPPKEYKVTDKCFSS